MKVSKIEEVLSKLDNQQEVYIQIGDNAYPATIRVFVEDGKHIPYRNPSILMELMRFLLRRKL
jgi:hypothetical protein